MAFTYTESNLDAFLTDQTSLAGALAWARKISGDTKNQGKYSDVAWQAELKADKVTYSGSTYYRPHATVARVIYTDPEWHISNSARLGSATYRTAAELRKAILADNAWIDRLIDAALGDSVSLDSLLNQVTQSVELRLKI